MKYFWLLLLLSYSLSVAAEELELNLLLLPLSTTGSFTPVDEDQLTRSLEQQLHAMQPKSRFQLARSAELCGWVYTAMAGADPRDPVCLDVPPPSTAWMTCEAATLRVAVPPFQPQPPELAALSRRVKAAFDPEGLLNPGRMDQGA